MSEMVRVGVLGLGKMGSAFATNLLSKRNEIHVYNRSKDRLHGLIAKGAIAHPSPIELGKSVDVVITSLPDQDVVDSVVMGDDGARGAAGHEEGSPLDRDEHHRPGRIYQTGRTSQEGRRLQG